MSTSVYTDDAVRRLAAARPLLVDVRPAREVDAHFAAGGISHAGPPIESARMCEPMRRAIGVALVVEGVASDPEAALGLVDSGAISYAPNHDLGGVGPMSGVVTASMPVLVARDAATGLEAWCPLNEGSGRVLRYGGDGPEVEARLAWMREVLGPELAAALATAGAIDLLEIEQQALLRGDECHHRTEVGTEIVAERLRGAVSPAVHDFIEGNGQFFLNLAMVAAKLALRCASGVSGSALVTAIARNGVDVGIQLSGTADQWFVGPAAAPDPANLFAGFTEADMNPDLGDSAIVETFGLGAFAVAASPRSAPSVGLDPSSIDAIDERLRRIAAAEHPTLHFARGDGSVAPAILGIDARAVVETGIAPPIHTGIAHRAAGVGQIGGGVTHPPMSAFVDALAALGAA